jgi:hypothetical protein
MVGSKALPHPPSHPPSLFPPCGREKHALMSYQLSVWWERPKIKKTMTYNIYNKINSKTKLVKERGTRRNIT